MNRFAKITALAAISAISLTACGANGDKGSSSASSSKTTSTASSAAQPSDSSADAVSFKPACPGGSISGAGSSAQLNAINPVSYTHLTLPRSSPPAPVAASPVRVPRLS